ncbi:MAG: hypothetical protein ABIQ86_00265 [Steroidobacteraceae bacterium]
MIALLTTFLRWIMRNVLSVAAIALVLYFGNLGWQEWNKTSDEVKAAVTSLPGLEASLDELQKSTTQSALQLEQRLQGLRQASASAIKSRLESIDTELSALRNSRRTTTEKARSLFTGHQGEIVGDYQRELKISLLDIERTNLQLLDHQRILEKLRVQHANAYAALAATVAPGLRPTCPPDPDSLRSRLPAIVSKTAARHLELCRENANAANAYKLQKDQYDSLTKPLSALNATQGLLRPIEDRLANAKALVDKKSLGIVLHEIASYLPAAMVILLFALLTPVAIKTFLFYVIAPIASRRPPIRLLPTSGENPVGASTPLPLHLDSVMVSSVSHSISIAPDHELLVHSDYLQSSGTGGNKNTKWLLNARYPLASLAAGMTVLTRIQPKVTDSVVVSSTTDPFSEVGVLDLEEDGALVLQPHNLVGVLQLRNRPIRITSHWRLGSLTAWLTLQLRYLVFHGPGSLVVKGCRGIRIEPAGTGRMINQAATMGFSANLAYSATRTETFVAYLMGKQELFNDRFSGGPGFYVYEEMPHFGKKSGITGRGLEGLLDSVLKVFGI